MDFEHDLVIRNGLVVDGAGEEPFEADLAVSSATITAVGRIAGAGREEIDARGCIVTPGFVDLHTHLDGNVTWESRLKPCSGHGVTTAVTGNCGVGFAPVRPSERDTIIRLMEGVEDIPFDVLKSGLPWGWETFPEYLDYVGARSFDMDVATLVPHSALRVYVMGERGMDEPATAEEVEQMAHLMGQAVAAGAIGFGSSRLTEQRSSDGRHVPSLAAGEAELSAIAGAMAAHGGGLLQMAPEFNEPDLAIAAIEMLGRVAKASGLPVTYSLKQSNSQPEGWRDILDLTARVNSEGACLYPQVLGRPTGAILSLDSSSHPFARCASYRPLASLPLAERVQALRDPQLRERLLSEAATKRLSVRGGGMRNVYELNEPLDYEPPPSESLEARAEALGVQPEALALDQLLTRDGRGLLLYTAGNYAQGTLDPALAMMRFPASVPGLGDGGAHSTVVCDASASTFMLSYWARDRVRGEKLPLAQVVSGLTRSPANLLGLYDRGMVASGYKADINIIDYDRLRLRAPRMVWDLPAGGKRLVQDAEGYVATIVSGQVVRRNDEPTDALPGKLVRNAKASQV